MKAASSLYKAADWADRTIIFLSPGFALSQANLCRRAAQSVLIRHENLLRDAQQAGNLAQVIHTEHGGPALGWERVLLDRSIEAHAKNAVHLQATALRIEGVGSRKMFRLVRNIFDPAERELFVAAHQAIFSARRTHAVAYETLRKAIEETPSGPGRGTEWQAQVIFDRALDLLPRLYPPGRLEMAANALVRHGIPVLSAKTL